jgi:hypothetical protein
MVPSHIPPTPPWFARNSLMISVLESLARPASELAMISSDTRHWLWYSWWRRSQLMG